MSRYELKWADGFIGIVILVGVFFGGVVWAPALVDWQIKGALEASSYIATIIACAIAVITLLAWRSQFRHAERYATLKGLKMAVTDLHAYRGFILAVKRSCDYQIANSGVVDPDLRINEIEKRQKMLAALADYNKAWAIAVGFLSADEEARIIGTPNKFALLSIERPSQLMEACRLCLQGESQAEYQAIMERFNAEAQEIYAVTVSEVERLLREKV